MYIYAVVVPKPKIVPSFHCILLERTVYSIGLWCVLSITEIDRNATGCVACSLRSLISLWWWSPPRFECCCCCCCLEIRNHNLDQPTSSVCVQVFSAKPTEGVKTIYVWTYERYVVVFTHLYVVDCSEFRLGWTRNGFRIERGRVSDCDTERFYTCSYTFIYWSVGWTTRTYMVVVSSCLVPLHTFTGFGMYVCTCGTSVQRLLLVQCTWYACIFRLSDSWCCAVKTQTDYRPYSRIYMNMYSR